MVLNFPLGKIFLGDGGAYAMGHLLVWSAIILVNGSIQVSAFAILLVFYGRWQTLAWPYGADEMEIQPIALTACIFTSSQCDTSRLGSLVEIGEKLLIQ